MLIKANDKKIPSEISPICSLIFRSTMLKPAASEILRTNTATNIEPTYIGILTLVKSVNVFPIYVPSAIQKTKIVNCIKKI